MKAAEHDRGRMRISSRILTVAAVAVMVLSLPGEAFCQPSSTGDPEVAPLDQPFFDTSYVSTWLGRRIMTAMSISFWDVEGSLKSAKKDFTDEGFRRFYSDLNDSGLLMLIEDAQMRMTVTARDRAVPVGQGVVDGRYSWAFQVPVIMRMQTNGNILHENKKLLVVVVRSNDLRHTMIAIDQWILSDDFSQQ